MSNIVLHIDMDAFFAAIEERDNPRFRGKPIVVGADPMAGHGRGVVSTANYQARKFGIKSAMPISWAYHANPKAVFLPVNMKHYVETSQKIMEIIKGYAKKMEQVSVDEAYVALDNESEVMNYKKAEKMAKKIKDEIWKREKLTCSIGIGPNKLVAKIASDYKKPNGLTVIRPENVLEFLDPMPANVIPGVGPKNYSTLQKLGAKTVKDVRKISREKLTSTFGVVGKSIWHMARGKDERQIQTKRAIKSVGQETTFQEDINNPRKLLNTIYQLLTQVFRQLEERKLKGKTVTIKIRYAWFETHTSQESQKEPIDLKTARKIALKLALPYLDKNKKVRLIGVRMSNF